MLSSTSNTDKHTVSHSLTSPMNPSNAPDRTHKRAGRSDGRTSPLMFPDPEDDLSSDTESFDEDDMYGSDSGGETISLTASSNSQVYIHSDHVVCYLANYPFTTSHIQAGR